MKVFLGGTVADSTWRHEIIPRLKVDYFNPVVDYWDNAAQERELHERETADFNLYVLTPRMEGYYSIAEVTDDSFKKADKTIFCYLPQDGDKKFSTQQLQALERLGKLVTSNGGVWKQNLDEVVSFLNSAQETAAVVKNDSSEFKNVFISYGRRHSLGFARKLFYRLTSQGYKVWFDMNDIPIGVDFQEQIDEGIQKADNFIFIISPHSVNSIYCYKEIVLAKKYKKRIIPILHVEPEGLWHKMDPLISKLNWIYARQKENFDVALEEWEDLDDFNTAFDGLTSLLEQDKEHISLHTSLLNKALNWNKKQRSQKELLYGNERKQAMQWLLKKDFKDTYGKWRQAPVQPTDLHAEYIVESKKFSESQMTDCFIAYDRQDSEIKDIVVKELNQNGISCWTDTTDIKKGTRFRDAIEQGVAEADNILFLISPNSVNSKSSLYELDLALKYKKRIIPLLITPTDIDELPIQIRSIQYIDFTNREAYKQIEVKDHSDVEAEVEARKEASPLQKAVNEILAQINDNRNYYHLHKLFLVQAIKWQKYGNPNSMLLREADLEKADAWLKLSETQGFKISKQQKELIKASKLAVGTLDFEVYMIHGIADMDMARKLNFQLQATGKTTWFGIETMADSLDEEHYTNGIQQSNNVIVVVSPEGLKEETVGKQINKAIELNKRIILVQTKRTSKKTLPELLQTAMLIDFVHKEFNSALSELIQALDTDKEHARIHTQIAQEARKWEAASKANDYLLRGQELENAIVWMKAADNGAKKPEVSPLQREFLERSREFLIMINQKEAQQKRIKRLFVIALIMSAIAILLALLAYRSFRESEIQRKLAVEQTKIAEANAQKAADKEKEAKKQAEIAQEQKEYALVQQRIAEEQRKIALAEKNKAENARIAAENARAEALRQKKIAETLKEEAETMAQMAVNQKNIAEYAEQKAQYYLYVFNAKNMSNEAINTDKKPELQQFLATTAIELNHIADSLAKVFHLKNPYIPTLTQALQNSFVKKHNNAISPEQSKSIIVVGNNVFFGNKMGGLSKINILENKDSLASFSKPIPLIDANIGIIYSMIELQGHLFFNTSKGSLYHFENNKFQEIKGIFSGMVKSLSELPNPNEMLINLRGNRSIIFRLDKFLAGEFAPRSARDTEDITQFLLQLINQQAVLTPNKSTDIMCFSPHNQSVISDGGNGKIILTTPDKIEEFPVGHEGLISDICLTDDGNWLATSSFDGSIFIWNLTDKKQNPATLLPIILKPDDAKYISSVSFSKDGNYLFYSDNQTIKHIPLNTLMLYKTLKNKPKNNNEQYTKWWNYYKRGDINRPSYINSL